MQQRERPAGAVQLGAPDDDEAAGFVEAAGRLVLLVDIDRQLAVQLPGMLDQPPAAAAALEFRGQEQGP